jgi:hypothetical protein
MAFNEKGPVLISSIIEDILGIDVSVLCGANIAKDVAWEHFSETTIGNDEHTHTLIPTYSPPRNTTSPAAAALLTPSQGYKDKEVAQVWKQVFHSPAFNVRTPHTTHTQHTTHASHSLFVRLV